MDDGNGFVYEELPDDQERSHTGIRNVRERLMRVAGAELVIDSGIGRGTTVTIILPQEVKNADICHKAEGAFTGYKDHICDRIRKIRG